MSEGKVAADFGCQVPDDGFENGAVRIRDVARCAGNSERFPKPGIFGAMQKTVGIAFCAERGIGASVGNRPGISLSLLNQPDEGIEIGLSKHGGIRM